MRPKPLHRRIFPALLVLILLALAGFYFYANLAVRQLAAQEARLYLENHARLVANALPEADSASIDALCKRWSARSPIRVTVLDQAGRVIGDSREDIARMDNHGDRPEVVQARRNGLGASRRHSNTLDADMMYVAIASPAGQRIVRASVELANAEAFLATVRDRILLVGVLLVAFAGVFSFIVSRRISRPLESLRLGAERLADGELTHQFRTSSTEEINALALALNRMAAQLHERFRTILRQRNEQETVLANMAEGVLAVDPAERLLIINQSAIRLLHPNASTAPGRSLQETVRSPELQQLIRRALAKPESIEADLTLADARGGEVQLQIRVSQLRDTEGSSLGALAVLNDVTRLRRLEQVRREFVANVSHELKTPVTSIKGFSETLLEGRLDQPEETRHFLEIIARQADRLGAIIEDLLALARIEQEREHAEIPLEPKPLAPLLQAAADNCAIRAQARSIALQVDCPHGLLARCNAPLLEQAVTNLLDNAIQHSGPGTRVTLSALEAGSEVRIAVADTGTGIAPEHLSRLFERFYRVDKARSRSLGGTGLGLAIVKHIILAHGGEVSVESTVGRGSCFTLHLPAVQPSTPGEPETSL